MFPVGAAAIFLVNRPCIARHRQQRLSSPALPMRATQKLSSLSRICRHRRPAKAVIAGLDPAIHREMG
jgi:hypothetical protein